MFKKTNEKEKNKDCSDNKVHVLCCKNVKKFNDHDFFIRIDAERRSDMNQKKYKAKNK